MARLSEQELRVIFKYFNKCGIDHIGTLVVNLVKFKNPNLTKENKNKLYKVLFENKNLVRYLINNNENKLEGKIKKLTTQKGGGLITALLSIGIPILVDIIASAATKKTKKK